LSSIIAATSCWDRSSASSALIISKDSHLLQILNDLLFVTLLDQSLSSLLSAATSFILNILKVIIFIIGSVLSKQIPPFLG